MYGLKLQGEYSRNELEINNAKTIQKEMRDLELENGMRIKTTNKYKYLGFLVKIGPLRIHQIYLDMYL